MTPSPKKQGIVLLNLGGPDSLDAVEPFLYNLFSDRDIIRLSPFSILQKPIARYIASSRTPDVKGFYAKMGGRSPILPLTQAQADALRQQLLTETGQDLPVYIAMRYWHPFTEETLQQLLADGIEDVILLPLYPHYSLTTTGSSVNAFNNAMAAQNITLNTTLIGPYYNNPAYLAAFAETVQEALDVNPWTCPKDQVQILFSAHSLPKKFVEKTQDVYPQQILEHCQLLMAQYFPQNPWELGYQSKVGKMPWIGPDTEGVLHFLAANHVENILMLPISFVCDHLETLYEMDQLYLGLARELKIPHCYRAAALNHCPSFIQALTQLVKPHLTPIASGIEASPHA